MSMRSELDQRAEVEAACLLHDVVLEVWVDHFGMSLPGDVDCRFCEDFSRGCPHDQDPVSCMRDNAETHYARRHVPVRHHASGACACRRVE